MRILKLALTAILDDRGQVTLIDRRGRAIAGCNSARLKGPCRPQAEAWRRGWADLIGRYLARQEELRIRFEDPWQHRFISLTHSFYNRRKPAQFNAASFKPNGARSWKESARRMHQRHLKQLARASGQTKWWDWAMNKASNYRKHFRERMPDESPQSV